MSALWFLIFTITLTACSIGPLAPQPSADRSSPVGQVVSSTFDANGRLWRLTPTAEYVYVDYSDDRGATFSTPVAVNADPQRIKAQPEDRPSIAVDQTGRISVLYFADAAQPWTTFFSTSSDGGRHFSEPVTVSDHARSDKHYEDIMAAAPDGALYVFWHDERDRTPTNEASLYYARTSEPGQGQFANQKIVDSVCNCCRSAVDFTSTGTPVLFKRMVYPGNVRDHGLVTMTGRGHWKTWRVTDDEWQIDACPEHGPSLSIAGDGRYHVAWFTQGRRHKGLFYAHSDDRGKTFSKPSPFGDLAALPGHPAVLAINDRVVLAWKQFDGRKTQILMMQSSDRGDHWTAPRPIAESGTVSDHPFLLRSGGTVFLSWNSADHGFRLLPIPQQ